MKKLMSVTTQCIKRKNNMSSLSPNENARRTSPRKSAGKMPHYLARESNKQKGGKGGKKSGGGVKKQGKESDSSSNDDSNTSVKSRKKSGGAAGGQKSGGTKSIGVSRGSKVAKVMKVTKPGIALW